MKSLPGNGLRQVITAAFLLFCVVFSLPGQTVTGTIAGTVLDPSGAAIPNAAITVTNEDTGIVRNSVATTDGVYTIPSLLPGKYTVEGKAQGFGTVQTKNVTVAVGSDTRHQLAANLLHLGLGVFAIDGNPGGHRTSPEIDIVRREMTVAKIDGEPFQGGQASDFQFLLGEGQMLKEFEDAVRGMDIVICTSAKTDKEAKALLKGFDLPFYN